jgi:hypothetical protein
VLLATCRGNHWFEKKKVRRFKKKVQEEGSRRRFKKKKTPKDTERNKWHKVRSGSGSSQGSQGLHGGVGTYPPLIASVTKRSWLVAQVLENLI